MNTANQSSETENAANNDTTHETTTNKNAANENGANENGANRNATGEDISSENAADSDAAGEDVRSESGVGPRRPRRGADSDPALERAFSEPGLRPLPSDVVALLRDLGAPPRLGAHLRAVHHVAVELLDRLGEAVDVDRAAVLFGAATHDIGKVLFPGELTGAGAEHEPAGEALLRSRGVEARLARFAALHGRWERDDATIDELLVTLADKVWKGRREAGLEQKVAEIIAAATGEAVWAVYMRLDDILTAIAGGADDRLAFQAAPRHP
ncbi:HD domain-containing protein [Dactylosporangium darangshiense]|uniref:HD domain-containing protein n=1 Tax=Dactylosporangium darangshiense TaxID=579108 RepID=UPI003629896F